VTGRLVDAAAPEDVDAAVVFGVAATGTGCGGRAATGTALWHPAIKMNPVEANKMIKFCFIYPSVFKEN
jgi:hypothetical protein